MTSKGLNISNSGILTKFDQESTSKQVSLADIHYLLSIGDEVGIQLEHKDIDLPITFLPATISRKSIINESNLEVGFEFQKSTDELRSLIHEISQG